MTSFTRSASGFVVGAIATVLVAAVAHADDAKPGKRVQMGKQVHETDVPKGQGKSAEARAREEAEEAAGVAVLERATSESTEGLVVRVKPDGSRTVDLQGRFQSVLVAVPTADGGQALACYDAHDAGAAVPHTHVAPAAPAPASQSSKLEEM